MRAAASPRNAVLFSVLAYAGLRPGEALALRWGDVRDQTLLIEKAISLAPEEMIGYHIIWQMPVKWQPPGNQATNRRPKSPMAG